MRPPSGFPWRRPGRQRPTRYGSSFHCSGLSLSSFPSSTSFLFSSPLSSLSYQHMSSTSHVVTTSFPCCRLFHTKPFVLTRRVPPYSVNTKSCIAAGSLLCWRSSSSLVSPCHLTTDKTSSSAFSGASRDFTTHSYSKTAPPAHHEATNLACSSPPFLLFSRAHIRHSFFFSSMMSCSNTYRDLEPSTTRGCIDHAQRQPFSPLHTSRIFSPSSVNTRGSSSRPSSSLSRRSSRFGTLHKASSLPSSKTDRSRTLGSSLFSSLPQVPFRKSVAEKKLAFSEASEEGRENKAQMRKGTACTHDREHELATQQHPCSTGENRDSSPVQVSPSSASKSSSLLAISSSSPPIVSSSSVPAEKEEEQRTLPACVQDTYIDLGYAIKTFDHYESAMRQLQTGLLLLLQANHHHYLSSARSEATTTTALNTQMKSFFSTPTTEKFRKPLAKNYLDMAMLSHQYNKLTEAVDAYSRALGLYTEEAVAAAENNEEEGKGKTDREGIPSSAFLDVSNCLSCLGVVETDRGLLEEAQIYLERAMCWKVAMIHGFPLSSVLSARGDRDTKGELLKEKTTNEKTLELSNEAATQLFHAPLQPNTVYFDTMNSLGGVYLRQGKVLGSIMCFRFAVECMYALCELYTGRRFRHLGASSNKSKDAPKKDSEGKEVSESPIERAEAADNVTLFKIFHAEDMQVVSSQEGSPSPSSDSSPPVSSSLPRECTSNTPGLTNSSATPTTSLPASSPPVFAYFFTVLCEALQTERAAAQREALAQEKETEELEKMKRQQQTEDATAAFTGDRTRRETSIEEHRLPSRTPVQRQPKSLAEDMLPYGTIVFYNLAQSLLRLGKPTEAREALEQAEALARLSANEDLQKRVINLQENLSTSLQPDK